MAKTICLSAGHGAGDPGVVYKNLKESELTIKIVKRAVEMIRKHSVDCLEVPDNLTLQQTITWINERADQIDICVEVHINSGGGNGAEAWNYVGHPNESDKLSQFLVDAVCAETGLPNRGIKDESTNRFGKLGFVHDTSPTAALMEIAFIDGNYDFLSKDENLTRAAKGVARGCLSYLELQWKPELINPPAPTPPVTPPTGYKAKYEVLQGEFDTYKQTSDAEITKQTNKVLELTEKIKAATDSANKMVSAIS